MTVYQQKLSNEKATLQFGQALARATFLPGVDNSSEPAPGEGAPTCGGVLYLLGDLGAGKTTLTRGIMRGFGYTGAVKSPTYTLVEPYEFTRCHIYHFDLYRLADPEEANFLGTDDYFSGGHLCIVEWAERGRGVIPPADLVLRLETAGSGRRLEAETCSPRGEEIAKRLWGEGRKI